MEKQHLCPDCGGTGYQSKIYTEDGRNIIETHTCSLCRGKGGKGCLYKTIWLCHDNKLNGWTRDDLIERVRAAELLGLTVVSIDWKKGLEVVYQESN